MAVAPMFVPSMVVLLTSLKLEGSGTAGGVQEVNDAVTRAALDFYRRLGAARIAQVQAIAHTDTPATDNDFLRVLAEQTELALVRQKLLRVKPTLFLDASGKAQQLWNDEGAFRPQSQKQIDEEIDRLGVEIQDGLAALEAGVAAAPKSQIQAMTIEPACKPDRPYGSVFPARRNPPFRGYSPLGGPGGSVL